MTLLLTFTRQVGILHEGGAIVMELAGDTGHIHTSRNAMPPYL